VCRRDAEAVAEDAGAVAEDAGAVAEDPGAVAEDPGAVAEVVPEGMGASMREGCFKGGEGWS
jgi:hypothetical protein